MANFVIEFRKSVEKDLRKIPESDKIRIMDQVRALSENPRPSGVKKCRGYERRYRIRVGDYRVLYDIFDDRFVVLVLRIGQRGGFY